MDPHCLACLDSFCNFSFNCCRTWSRETVVSGTPMDLQQHADVYPCQCNGTFRRKERGNLTSLDPKKHGLSWLEVAATCDPFGSVAFACSPVGVSVDDHTGCCRSQPAEASPMQILCVWTLYKVMFASKGSHYHVPLSHPPKQCWP